MNGAVRAVVRAAIAKGCEAYVVFEGYEGLVKGGDLIKKVRPRHMITLMCLRGNIEHPERALLTCLLSSTGKMYADGSQLEEHLSALRGAWNSTNAREDYRELRT